jgi:site-specific recombinase XerD
MFSFLKPVSQRNVNMPTYNNLPAASQYFKGKWYLKLIEDLQLAGKAKRTVYGYVRAVRKLADFHQHPPHSLEQSDIRAFLLHQIVDKQVASGTQSVLLSGIKFFYRTTCPREWDVLDQTRLNYAKSLPEVITQPQVFQIIDASQTRRIKTFVWTTYTLGLRIGEAVNLQVSDLDSERMMVHVHRGKGAKAPYVYRIAITNNRIVSVTDNEVVYRVKPSVKNQVLTRRLPGLLTRKFEHRLDRTH